jgi:DNA-binding HxlR family transcriptional regulator
MGRRLASPVDASIDDESRAATRPGPRVGGRVLSVLATPLNLLILRALADRRLRLADLRKATGLPAQTTLRGHLANLGEIGVLRKRPTQQMPYAVENELTPMGRDLLGVSDRLELWLRQAPDGPISLESGAAKGAVKALVDGWGSKMMRALAARPLSLTELDSLISDFSYPALERRLSSMRMAGLVEAQPSLGVGTPYAVTDWARRGVAPLVAATHCERVHMGAKTAPLTQIDIETAFLLAMPLVGLPERAEGSCQLAVDASPDVARRPAGVTVKIGGGKVVSCVSRLEPKPGAYAIGSPGKWFHAISEGNIEQLRFGGGQELAENLVSGLHAALSGR